MVGEKAVADIVVYDNEISRDEKMRENEEREREREAERTREMSWKSNKRRRLNFFYLFSISLEKFYLI